MVNDPKKAKGKPAAPPATASTPTTSVSATTPASSKPSAPKDAASLNAFLLRDLFPDVGAVIAYTSPKISTLVSDCVFVPDSNVLLAPFKFGGKGLTEIARIYRELSKNERLFVAEWSLREFAKHRTDDLIGVYQTLGSRMSKAAAVEGLRCPLLEGLDEYGAIQETIRDINKATEHYKSLLQTLQAHVRDWSWNDRVSELYRDVFKPANIITCSLTDDRLVADMERRNAHGIPPGYKDKSKLVNNIGDVIIWHSLIELASTRKKNVVFISNEEKHDWVHKSDRHVIVARSELYDEFHRATGQHFGYINWLGFLQLLAQDEDAIKQAELIGLDTSHSYKSVQQRINSILDAVVHILRQFLTDDHEGMDYAYVDDPRLKILIQEFYSVRGQYDELIHSPTGSRYLAEMEVALEEIEHLNGRLKIMEARMKYDGSADEALLTAACTRLLELHNDYSTWYLAGCP